MLLIKANSRALHTVVDAKLDLEQVPMHHNKDTLAYTSNCKRMVSGLIKVYEISWGEDR